MLDLTDPAYYYLDNGFNPIPANENKVPILPAGHRFFEQDIDNIEERFKDAKIIGIAAGKVSNGIECIDFDAHENQPIHEIFNQFTSDPEIKRMIRDGYINCIQTRSGYHILFISEYSGNSTHLAKWKDQSVMIEIRSNGSYFATVPSPGYSLIHGVETIKLQQIEKEERDYILDFARQFSKVELSREKSRMRKQWPDSFDDNDMFGYFNNHGDDYAKNILKKHGWKLTKSQQRSDKNVVEYWTRPGKHKGVSATFGQFHNMFYVFSSSTKDFQDRKAYTPVDIVLKLEFKNDFQRFKLWLQEKFKIKLPEPETNRLHSFPIEVFPEPVQEYIRLLNQANNYNTDFLSIAVMFVFATINGNKIKLRVKNDWIAPTIFWSIAVGEPGTMKTHPLNSIIKPLKIIDKLSKKYFDCELDEWNQLSDEEKKKNKRPKYKQVLVSDYTLEALHEIHSYNKNGLGLYRDEIVGFLNDMNKYRKGSDQEFWLESFNNNSYAVNRVTKDPLLIDNININIIGSIQPDVLEKVTSESAGNGLIDRFLYTVAETEIKSINLEDISQSWIDWWRDNVVVNQHALFNSYEDSIIDMTDAARKKFVQIDKRFVKMQNSEDESNSMKNYISKMKTYVPRFALVCAIMDAMFEDRNNTLIVDEKHFEKAENICNYFIPSARYIFGETNKKKEIREVASKGNGMTTAEKIIMLHGKSYTGKDIAKQVNVSPAYVSKVISAHKNRAK